MHCNTEGYTYRGSTKQKEAQKSGVPSFTQNEFDELEQDVPFTGKNVFLDDGRPVSVGIIEKIILEQFLDGAGYAYPYTFSSQLATLW